MIIGSVLSKSAITGLSCIFFIRGEVYGYSSESGFDSLSSPEVLVSDSHALSALVP